MDKFIHDFFDKKDSNENKNEGKFCYASLKIDASGKYINNTIGISTLPWALGQLETKKISSNNWSQPFLDFEEKI